jgi:cell division protease FtsH
MPFVGRDVGGGMDYSDEVAHEIDDEIRRIVEDARQRARQVLADHMAELHQLSELLIEYETIDRDQFERLLAGEAPESVFPPPEDDDETSSDGLAEGAKDTPYPLPGALAKKLPPESTSG